MQRFTYTNKLVAVTGAGGGLGEALANSLEQRGAVVARISRQGFPEEGMTPETWQPYLYDAVFLSAGFGMLQAADTVLETHDFHEMVALNLVSTIGDAQCALAHSCEHVHIVGSIISIVGSPGYALYAATKYGLRGWAYSAARELPGRVSISYPNGMRTAYFKHLRGDPALLAQYAGAVEQAQAEYDSPEAVAEGILNGISYGAREIIPTRYALDWFLRNGEDVRRMWHPGLTFPSNEPFPWWNDIEAWYAKVHASWA